MQNKDKIKLSDLADYFEKQNEAHQAVKDFKYILYGGAMGGGKSYWLRWELVRMLMRWHVKYQMPREKEGRKIKPIIVGLFCEDYPALKDRQISKIAVEMGGVLGEVKDDDKEYGRCFKMYPEYGGGIILLRNLDDPSKYQSAEFAAIAVDELTKNTRDSFDDLRNRLRWPLLPAKEWKFIAATNPGGIGHAWVKKKWMDGIHEPTEQESDKFCYVPSKAVDNPHLEEAYIKSLEGLPREKRKAFLEGDWNIFKGQYFTQWRNEIHIVKPFNIPENWKKFICLDYGYSAPSAVYWCAIDHDDVIYLYRELYETELTFKQLTDEIVSMTPDNERIDYWVADPAIWAKRGEYEDGLSGADKIKNRYRELMKGRRTVNKNLVLKKGNNDRINGWNVMREYLTPFEEDGKLKARLQVFDNCKNFIVTFPSLVYDKNKVEDLDSNGEDHAADAVRYGIMSKPNPTESREEFRERWFKRRRDKKKKSKGGITLMRGY